MGNIVLTTGGQSRLLRGKVPLLTSWRLGVFANNLTPTRDTLIGDVILANARFQVGGTVTSLVTPSWPTPAFIDGEGRSVMTSGLIDVIPGPAQLSVSFFGWCLFTTDPFLMMAARFDGLLPIVVDRGIPATAFLFRINLAEDSIP